MEANVANVMTPVEAEHHMTCTAAVQHVWDNFALSEALLLLSSEYVQDWVAVVKSGTDNTGCKYLGNA